MKHKYNKGDIIIVTFYDPRSGTPFEYTWRITGICKAGDYRSPKVERYLGPHKEELVYTYWSGNSVGMAFIRDVENIYHVRYDPEYVNKKIEGMLNGEV